MSEFKGKTALIVGGTSGIGRETAFEFARAGANVVITGRREREGEAVADEARRYGVKALFVKADVTSDADHQRIVRDTVSLTGRLDIAFNNAGYEGEWSPLADANEENYERIFDTNVRGVFLGMKHQIRQMLKQGGGGAIVNNASTAGTVAVPTASLYVASKHAVIGMSKTAAIEYAKQGIRINIVSPAAIQTEMYDRAIGQDAEKKAAFAAAHPIGRVGRVEEVASAVLWLCSPGASFMIGHDLRVDGGYSAP